MKSRRIKDWIWYPNAGQGSGFAISLLLLMALFGVLDLPIFPAFKKYGEISGTAGEYIAWASLIYIYNFILIINYARGGYLRLFDTFMPCFSFLTLTSLFALSSLYIHEYYPNIIELDNLFNKTTAKIFFVSQGAIAGLLLVSSLWKNDDKTFFDIGQHLREFCATLKIVYNEKEIDLSSSDEIRKKLIYNLSSVVKIIDEIAYTTNSDNNYIDNLKHLCVNCIESLSRGGGEIIQKHHLVWDEQLTDQLKKIRGFYEPATLA